MDDKTKSEMMKFLEQFQSQFVDGAPNMIFMSKEQYEANYKHLDRFGVAEVIDLTKVQQNVFEVEDENT